MSLRLGWHALTVPLFSLVAACGAPTAGVPCGGAPQGTAVARSDGIRLLDGQEAPFTGGAFPLVSHVRFSGAPQGVLVLTETLAFGGAPALRVRRCPVVLEASSSGQDIALSGIWASRGCVFPSEGVLAAETVVSIEAHVELPSGQAAPYLIPVVAPGLARGLVGPQGVPVGLARDEWFAVARGGKRKNLRTCGDMLEPLPFEIPPPEGGTLFCYSLDEMSSFAASVAGAASPAANAALMQTLNDTRDARGRALAAMDPSTRAAFESWLSSASLEKGTQRALVALAERVHPLTCADKASAEAALCAVASDLRASLAATFPAAALVDFDAVLAAKTKLALAGGVVAALSRHQVDASGGKPSLVANLYASLFRAYDAEWDEWTANAAPSFAAETGVIFTNSKVTQQGGVRGAVLLAVAPAAVERVYNAADGGWLLTLGGGLPLATVLSLKGDGGTEGTSGGVPLRPLPVAKPENDGHSTNGSSDVGKGRERAGEVGSLSGSTPVGGADAGPAAAPKVTEPEAEGQSSGPQGARAEEPRPSGREDVSSENPAKANQTASADPITCLVR